MGMFTKKYDLEKDRLRIQFDPNEKKYAIYYGPNLLNYDLLNRKTKKILNEKNQLLSTDQSLLEKELQMVEEHKRFNELKSMGYLCNCFEYLGPNNGTMSPQMDQYLNNLTALKNVLLGIHRVGDSASIEKIQDILENGLEITGHLGGAVNSSKELSNNVGYYANNKKIIKELMYADHYKNSKGSILIKIPDSDLAKGDILIRDSDGRTRLDPKYILGYIPLEPNHHISKLVQLEKQNIYNSSQSGYSYDYEQQYNQTFYDEEIRKRR